MALIDFKGKVAAENWKRELSELNNRTDQALKDVGNTIKEIQTESVGDPVDQLVETGANLLNAAAEVIKGLQGLESAIQNIINLLIQKISEAAQAVADNRAKGTDL